MKKMNDVTRYIIADHLVIGGAQQRPQHRAALGAEFRERMG
jgi:hypothetical protein